MSEQQKRWAAVRAGNGDWSEWFEADYALRDERGWTRFVGRDGADIREYETALLRQIRWHVGEVKPERLGQTRPPRTA